MKKLKTFALTLLITGAIDSIRNLPASALFGSTLIFFFTFAAITFLVPTALVSAELAANVDEGGIYQWGRLAFGERVGFLAVWLQWVNNLVWFPAILSFIAGTAAYLIDPALAQSKAYLVTSILTIFWALTLINLRGIHLSAKFTSFCAIIGLIVPMILIIVLLLVWVLLGNAIQIHFTVANMFPSFTSTDNWIALTAIMLGFAGMELATVHVKEVRKPQKTFPKALGYSSVIILITMMLGSLAIACVLPYDKINLVNGTIQSFAYFLSAYHLSWLTPVLTLLLVIGSLGGMISWVISPIKGLSQAAKHGFLPALFERHNVHGVSQNLLIGQAILVSFVCFAFLFFPSVNASYWLLSSLTTELLMIMYIVMFLSALQLRKKLVYPNHTFVIPGKRGLWSVCLLGLVGCTITFLVGFIPPHNINIGSKLYYEFLFCSGIVLLLSPVLFLYWYQSKKSH
ncbi:MAG TPA: APC family permease [Gammaproteobacteria bacterium]|jgi:amino acid transporter|nr:APC family permease [Gammaproteobacteria bacterium]